MARAWAERIWLAVCAVATLAVLGFYAERLLMPLPLFAADEAAYLIRALYPDPIVALNPSVAPANNGVHLSVIRAVYETGLPYVIGDRIVNAAAYLGGLVLLWGASVKGTPRADRAALLLLALGFAYYRFAASNLAEGLFVGVLVLIALATGRWYRSRPVLHAIAAGVLGAILVLVKPNGVAALAALGAVAVLDAAASGGWRRLPLRVLLFAAAFFPVGNLIQIAADEPAAHPLAFFVAQNYGAILQSATPAGALRLGALALFVMTSAAAVLAGAPAVIGLADLIGRWRRKARAFVADGRDLVFLFLVLALGATLVMTALFTMQAASTTSETLRLWGRYFEFFAPLIWLAAAPALARPIGRRTALAAAAATLAGLAGLMLGFRAGIVLFPWDSSVLTAFFHADPVRAPLAVGTPYRALATGACLLAALAMGLAARPAQAGLGLILALSLLSTQLDHIWVGPMVAQRAALERDVGAIRAALPAAGEVVFLAPEENNGHLGFLRLDARPRTYIGPPAQTPPGELATAQAVVVSGPEAPPGAWTLAYRGEQLSLFKRP